MIASKQSARLKLVDQLVCFLQSPVSIFFIPHAIEPDAGYFTIVSE
jgi:hypothetical protein